MTEGGYSTILEGQSGSFVKSEFGGITFGRDECGVFDSVATRL